VNSQGRADKGAEEMQQTLPCALNPRSLRRAFQMCSRASSGACRRESQL